MEAKAETKTQAVDRRTGSRSLAPADGQRFLEVARKIGFAESELADLRQIYLSKRVRRK